MITATTKTLPTTWTPTHCQLNSSRSSTSVYASFITGICHTTTISFMTLLGDPRRPPSMNTGSNDAPTNPVEQVNHRLKQFVSSLKPTINTLCTTAVTIKNIGNVISTGSIPICCTQTCQLRVPNPPLVVTRPWNDCLTECGKHLTAILINYHSECHQNMLQAIQDTIDREFQKISMDVC